MRNRFTSELAVCGFNAVAALAKHSSAKVNRLFLREDRLPQFRLLCQKLAEKKRPYKLCADDELEKICKHKAHQGVVAMIYAPEIPGLTRDDIECWAGAGGDALLLYRIGNDHNLGAIVRSAAFFDLKHIVLCDDEDLGADAPAAAPALSTAAYRVAEGGMEHVSFYQISDAGGFLREASKRLVTICTDPRSHTRIQDLVAGLHENAERNEPRGKLLVLGNEESGIPAELQKLCRHRIRIAGTGLLDSLNVSAAAAIIMHQLYLL